MSDRSTESPADGSSDRAVPLVYLITDRHATGGRPLGQVVGEAVRAFADTGRPPSTLAVQLREKDLEGRALLALARELRAVTADAGVRLFVNDRVDVALAANADGVHLGGGALSASEVRGLAPRLQLAASTHTVADVARSAADGRFSFVVFGPVFETPSKRGLGSPVGLDGLRAAASQRIPVLALGGVGAAEARACRAEGAAGIACIRAILANRDPGSALQGIFEAIERT